jgi:outer membrane protein TolC
MPLLLVQCTSGFYRKLADKETFGILRKKSSKVPNVGDGLMNIDPPPPIRMADLERKSQSPEFLGDRQFVEKEASQLTLAKSLSLSVERNRPYLRRKEIVYLDALDLTLARQRFSPILDGGGSSNFRERQVETGVNNFIRTSTLTTTGDLGLTALGRTGTRIATDLTTDFVRFFTGGLGRAGDSSLAFTLSQPLLRGAGYLAASEVLTQAERDVLYSIRDFTQFRKDFTIDIADSYFRVLQAREAAKNAFMAYQAFKGTVERENAMAEANRRSKSSLGRLRQADISNNRRWINAVRSYEQALDNFKLDLGIPVEERIVLDEADLSDLKIVDPPGTLEEAIQTAMSTRLDLWNSRDEVEDAERRVCVAKQELLPTLNSVVSYDIDSRPGSRGLELANRQRDINAGLDLDLNLNQKPERNVLRGAEIELQRRERDLELAEESLRNQVRASWRDLEVARKQYDLAQEGLALSEERLQIEEAFNLEGQGTALDLIDAQQDLIDARNLVVSTLINHTIARLQLWRDMGILFVRKDGSWESVLKKEPPRPLSE